MEQKFKRGNKVMDGKKEAIIVGSYADKYGGSNRKDYTIMFCETGSTMSWMHESQLQFVEDGGEFLFEQAKVNHDRILKQNLDIDFIKENLNGGLSSDSILFRFRAWRRWACRMLKFIRMFLPTFAKPVLCVVAVI